MTTRKAREFWIAMNSFNSGEMDVYETRVEPFDYCPPAEVIKVQEVLPEPTNAELYEMSQQANACELHFRQGFQAALKWMKGESE